MGDAVLYTTRNDKLASLYSFVFVVQRLNWWTLPFVGCWMQTAAANWRSGGGPSTSGTAIWYSARKAKSKNSLSPISKQINMVAWARPAPALKFSRGQTGRRLTGTLAQCEIKYTMLFSYETQTLHLEMK